MARIAGCVSSIKNDDAEVTVRRMLSAMRANPQWTESVLSSTGSSVGWTGWTGPNSARIGNVIAVMDGGIYNRSDLGPAATDAHLLCDLYLRLGFERAICSINGDFAAALYDVETNSLWLARDRFGVKPLYFSDVDGMFAFASRPKGFLTLPGVIPRVNRRFVALFASCHYRCFDNDPEASPYHEISQLPASHILCVRNGTVIKTRYWDLKEAPDLEDSEVRLAEQYRELLLDSVRMRVVSANRPAFTLSGGMDSSSVLSCAVKITGRQQVAFSSVYDDKTYDESEDIVPMLSTKVEHWHGVRIDPPDLFDMIPRMIRANDEPVATSTWLSHFILCGEASGKGYRTLFGGLGGDELNAGEYEYFLLHFADLKGAREYERLDAEIEMWVRYHDHPIFRKSKEIAERELNRLVDPSSPGKCHPDWRRIRRYLRALNPEYFSLDDFEPVMEHPFRSCLKNRTYQDLFRETMPCCLRADDRQTNENNLDSIMPFLDYRLVEFMFRIPGSMKIRNGITKHLLREAMRGTLPEETRTRVKKTGWNAPAHVWFSGKGREDLLDLVMSRAFRERGIYDVDVVRRLIDEHADIVSSGLAVDNHMMFLWQLVNLELWLQGLDTNDRDGADLRVSGEVPARRPTDASDFDGG